MYLEFVTPHKKKNPIIAACFSQIKYTRGAIVSKIAYIDHSYHEKTKSTDFIPEILVSHGHEVDRFWDSSWNGGDAVEFNDVEHYDAIVLFQLPPQWSGALHKLHPNITFIPMLDGLGYTRERQLGGVSYWSKFANIKILNFSKTVHYVCNAFGLESRYFQYFQPPQSRLPAQRQGLHGFFWARREDQISVNTILALIGDTKFDSLHIHLAPDPGAPIPEAPSREICQKFTITTSNWFEKKEDFEAVLGRANVFFAPRLEEGIGQAMLEAFSRGQCVVAPDCGTMNEYIMHDANGLLYRYDKPTPLDFSKAVELGSAGHTLATKGFSHWKSCEQDLVQFILTPCENFYRIKTPSMIKECLKSIPFILHTVRKAKSLFTF